MDRKKDSYVELHASSAFNFLRAASNPEDMAVQAARCGLPAMALCDRDGVYGAARFLSASREAGTKALVGAELTMEDGGILPVLVSSRKGYQNLCRLITDSKLRSAKNESRIDWKELAGFSEGLIALTGDKEGPLARVLGSGREPEMLERLENAFGAGNVYVELQRHYHEEQHRLSCDLAALAESRNLPILATNGVKYSCPGGRALLDVFTCLRHHTHLDAAGRLLESNNERHIKSGGEMMKLFHDVPEAVRNSVRLAERLEFTLENLGYEFPSYPVLEGQTMDSYLRDIVGRNARIIYKNKVPEKVRLQLDKELNLIAKLGFSGYFLLVWDLVEYAKNSNILIQGRGSAANSAVCYTLGITTVDAVKEKLLFERFLSEGRGNWPDIDLDLPSGDKREQVIQYVYQKYGPRGAAMTANVITYRGRSAMRELGKALHLPPEILDRYSSLYGNGDFPETLQLEQQLLMAGLPADHPRKRALLALTEDIRGLPRHLGQHSGGMIICQGMLDCVVPLENASMPGRVVAQWDKDDCQDLGIIKVDLLGLGMMSVLQDAVKLCSERDRKVELVALDRSDPEVYGLMQRADTVGVFQIESRAQMATLPRMKPENFYDVAIEVAIIRPGPIQGNLMHPYLARREGVEPVTYFGYPDKLKDVLERTLGVPLFQEQMLQIAMRLAGFSGTEAEELRRALSFHRSDDRMKKVEIKLRDALAQNNIEAKASEEIVKAIRSFALYGFPESHAISFANLVYASCYLKVHRTVEFYTSLLNNQPVGFYSPATLVQDARRHGIRIKPVCIRESAGECRVEDDNCLRLGLQVVRGLSGKEIEKIIEERKSRPFDSLKDLIERTGLSASSRRTLAALGAFNGLSDHRRQALWDIEGEYHQDLFGRMDAEKKSPLRAMTLFERLNSDYDGMEMTTGPHGMAALRSRLPDIWRASDLALGRSGEKVWIAGSVICRQRPGTAKGVVFLSLEDETGVANAVVFPALFESRRLVINQMAALKVGGELQLHKGTIHVIAEEIEPLLLEELPESVSHDFK